MKNNPKHVIIKKHTKKFFKLMKKENEIKNIYYEKIFDSNKDFFSTIMPIINKFNKKIVMKTGYASFNHLGELRKKLNSIYDFSFIKIDISKIKEDSFDLNLCVQRIDTANSLYHSNTLHLQLDIVFSILKNEPAKLKSINFFSREKDPCGDIVFYVKKNKINYTIREDISIEVSYDSFLKVDFYCNELGFKNDLNSLFKIYPEQMLQFFFSGQRLTDSENDFSLLQLDFDFNEVVGNDVDIPYVTNLDSKMNFDLIKKPFIKRLFNI